MNIVIGGHVDHGKSTIIGRLLADTGSLPEGKLKAVRALCERTSKPFEYAFLLDALKDERAQGITIDAARVFFKTAARDYIIIDAPGHIEFLKNMITGAARAEAALLVIDAKEGIRENSRRHGYMMALLGIRQHMAAILRDIEMSGCARVIFGKPLDDVHEGDAAIGLSSKVQSHSQGLQRRRGKINRADNALEGDVLGDTCSSLRWHREDGTRGFAQHRLGHRAQEHPLEPATAMGPHHDQIRAIRQRLVENRRWRVP